MTELPVTTFVRCSRDSMMSQPVMLGSFSYMEKDDFYEESDEFLRILHLPQNLHRVSFDLAEGYVNLTDGGANLCGYSDVYPGLKRLPRWILNNRDKLSSSSGARLAADFVAARGIFAKVMTTPYDRYASWIIDATKYKGTIYLFERVTEARKREDENPDEHSNRCTYGGFRFEEYLTESLHGLDYDPYEKRDFECVATSRIGGYRLVYTAEMDCIMDKRDGGDGRLSLSDFVEIKTTRKADKYSKNYQFAKHKLVRWWAQSFLIGTENVVCGYRDEDMVVREMEILNVRDMVRMGSRFWSPEVCNGFLKKFLDFVKDTVKEDDPRVMYEFTCEPGRNISWTKKSATRDRHVIPDWYIDAL